MNKPEFIKIANGFDLECNYMGKTNTMFIKPKNQKAKDMYNINVHDAIEDLSLQVPFKIKYIEVEF